MTSEQQRQEHLESLLRLDYDKTTKFIDDVLQTSTTLRGWAVTLWIAVVGVAIQTRQGELALLGLAVVALFLVLDLYHCWLYREASGHARSIERIWSRQYESLGRAADDEEVALEAQALIEAHSFGLFLHFRRFRFWHLRHARLTGLFGYVYGALTLFSVVLAVAISSSS